MIILDFIHQLSCEFKAISEVASVAWGNEKQPIGIVISVNHLSSDSMYVCQIVVDAWPVKKSDVKTVQELSFKDNNCRDYQAEVSRTKSQDWLKFRIIQKFTLILTLTWHCTTLDVLT